MIQPSPLSCSACHTTNRPHRGYCRECGESLQPVCRGCQFVNERGDRYCGGCGSALAQPRGTAAPELARTNLAALPAELANLDELAELLRPLAEPARNGELPASGITQSDLDRLFGGQA